MRKEDYFMAFTLNQVVPWGRNYDEYRKMFLLSESDMKKHIASFGDGPASFNCEAHKCGFAVTSFDPIYQYSAEQLAQRIAEVRQIVMQQMRENADNYVWREIPDMETLESIRMDAMRMFLHDFEAGKTEGRYICHELPDCVPFPEGAFDIGLSSHFLLMYTSLGYEFHVKAITEMLRVCREVRIFPLVDLDAKESDLISSVIEYFKSGYHVEIRETSYEFQKGANRLLIITR